MKQIILLSILFLVNIYSFSQAGSPTCINSQPFCAGGTSYVFPNTTGNTGLGTIGCLVSTPNPAWFTFTITQPGNINLTLSQGNNAPFYDNQDVDFILWGPFNSVANATNCANTFGYPSTNTAIPNNIVRCSYSISATESFTISPTPSPTSPSGQGIPGGVPGGTVVGQVFLILITNYSDNLGSISFTQNSGSTGAIGCEQLCPLSIGPNQQICPGNSNIFTATISGASSYVWSSTATGFVNPGTQSITVTQPGTYTVVVNKAGCVANGTASATLSYFVPPTFAPPNNISSCTTFNLSSNTPVVLNGASAANFSVSYHTTAAAAQFGTAGPKIPNALLSNYPGTNGQQIWVSVEGISTPLRTTGVFDDKLKVVQLDMLLGLLKVNWGKYSTVTQ